MTATAPMPVLQDLDEGLELKEYVIFRLDIREGSRELADESDLQAEAERYAEIMAACEDETGIRTGISYEVRCTATGGLLYTTEDVEATLLRNSPNTGLALF